MRPSLHPSDIPAKAGIQPHPTWNLAGSLQASVAGPGYADGCTIDFRPAALSWIGNPGAASILSIPTAIGAGFDWRPA